MDVYGCQSLPPWIRENPSIIAFMAVMVLGYGASIPPASIVSACKQRSYKRPETLPGQFLAGWGQNCLTDGERPVPAGAWKRARRHSPPDIVGRTARLGDQDRKARPPVTAVHKTVIFFPIKAQENSPFSGYSCDQINTILECCLQQMPDMRMSRA